MVSAPLPAIAELKESDSKSRLRLWIRLLRASRLIESVARERLKVQFNATLPRFDVMAALKKTSGGKTRNTASRRNSIFLNARENGTSASSRRNPIVALIRNARGK